MPGSPAGRPTAFLGTGASPAASQTSHQLRAVREPRSLVSRSSCSLHPQRGGSSVLGRPQRAARRTEALTLIMKKFCPRGLPGERGCGLGTEAVGRAAWFGQGQS